MPTLLTVIRLGLHAYPHSAVSICVVRNTLSRLSIGSPWPMNTMFVSDSRSGNAYIWFRMSAAVRCPSKPCLPVWQNKQFMRQPTWHDTHSVARSWSGMYTVSTNLPEAVGNRYFIVPSLLFWQSIGSIAPTVKCSARRSRLFFEMLVISSMLMTCLSYSHLAICPPVNAGMPSSLTAAFNSSGVIPISIFLLLSIVLLVISNVQIYLILCGWQKN